MTKLQVQFCSPNGAVRGIHRRFLVFCSITLLVFSAGFNQAQDDELEDESTVQENADTADFEQSSEPIEELTVTGTRLTNPDLSRRVESISAEEIAARGLATAEEIIRRIPQNFSAINSATNLDSINPVVDRGVGALALGIQTANLNGFGSAGTLVLVNGKRIAGEPNSPSYFANLRDIPSGSIESIEVMLDGGSTIYGSDPVGGVINIITKKNYKGFRVNAHFEDSNTEADSNRIFAGGGISWDGGGVSGTLTRTESWPVNTEKAGWVTKDYSPYFGGDQLYNFNNSGDLRVGAVGFSRWARPNLTLGPDHDGRNALPEDFRPVNQSDWNTKLERDSTGATEDLGATFNIEHQVTDSLWLGSEITLNSAYTSRKVTRFGQFSIVVPESNAFNNFGQDVWVSYNPRYEIENGMIELPNQESERNFDRVILRSMYQLNENWELSADITRSESTQESIQWMFGTQIARDYPRDALATRIDELLSSSDPNVAVNLFGNGTGQNPTIAEMVVPISQANEGTLLLTYEGFVRGSIMELNGDTLDLVAGGEIREESRSTQSSFYPSGVARPKRELTAIFAELRIPVVDPSSDIPLVDDFLIFLSSRFDSYSTEGANGSDDADDPIIINTKYEAVTKRLGFYWELSPDFNTRVSFSESFRAPTATDLFGTYAREFPNPYDPLCSCFVPSAVGFFGPNPDLDPEVSDNFNIGLLWTPSDLKGLTLKFDYTQIDFQDRITSSNELQGLLPLEEYAYLPQFFERAADGTLIRSISQSINVSRRLNQTISLDVGYAMSTDWGLINPRIVTNYVIDMYDQATEGAIKARFLEELNGIDKYKVNGYLDIIRDDFTLSFALNHTPEYVNNAFKDSFTKSAIPLTTVSAHTTIDGSASYRFGNGITVKGGARNLLNKSFPFALTARGHPYDAQRVDLRGRVIFFDVSYEWGQG